MNLLTETSSHRNNTSTIQTRTIQKKRNKPITKKKIKHQHIYSWKWSSKHEIWGEEIRTHTFFLKIWRWTNAKMEFVEGDTECLDEFQLREKVNSHKKFKGKLKKFFFFKLTHFFPNTRFSRLGWVANKLPGQVVKTFKEKIVKKFSKCFSWLEGLLASELRAEPWKSLCTPRDWTFHSWTSRQN